MKAIVCTSKHGSCGFWHIERISCSPFLVEVVATNGIFNTLEWFFGGRLAPLALMPVPMHTLAAILPFRWAFSFPVETLLNRLTVVEMGQGFAVQTSWIIGCLPVMTFIWRAGMQRYAVVGG